MDSNCYRHVFKLAAPKYEFLDSCIRVSGQKKLVFSSFVSTFYEFQKRETPKLVFYPTYKEWPYQPHRPVEDYQNYVSEVQGIDNVTGAPTVRGATENWTAPVNATNLEQDGSLNFATTLVVF